MSQDSIPDHRLYGNVGYLLFALVVLHFAYPLSELHPLASAVYVIMYCITMSIGAYVTAVTRKRMIIGVILSAGAIGTGIFWAITSNDRELNIYLFVFYIVIIASSMFIGWEVLEFIFVSEQITKSVLIAGITFYMMLGSIFTPIYFLLNAIIRLTTGVDAFIIGSQAIEITWQRMYYFSFTTLTTLGYGDITPVSPFVEPFVTAEAIMGVLYTAVLMARLVSLYERDNIS